MSYPIEHDPAAGQFTATVEGKVSMLQYRLKPGVMKIVHTEVPAELSGHGIAADLMRAALDFARASGWRVVPACSYARAFLERHPEYSGLLA
jgi:predicted GNAT family acetyltransferase